MIIFFTSLLFLEDEGALKEECYAWKTSFPFLR